MKTKRFFFLLVLSSCALTPTQQAAVDKITADIIPIVANYAATGQVNYAQAIPLALDTVTAFDPKATVSLGVVQSKITSAVSAFTNGTGKSTGAKIANVVLAVLPSNPTGAQVNTTITQASVAASLGANP